MCNVQYPVNALPVEILLQHAASVYVFLKKMHLYQSQVRNCSTIAHVPQLIGIQGSISAVPHCVLA